LRIQVPPANAEAGHSPEKGFIVNHLDAWLVRPDGSSEKIAFRFLAPDAVDSLIADIARDQRHAKSAKAKRTQGQIMDDVAAGGGVLADPSLFFTRWVVAVPDKPLSLAEGAKLRLQLTQTEAVNQTTGAAPRLRLSTSNDPGWIGLAHSSQIEKKHRGVGGA